MPNSNAEKKAAAIRRYKELSCKNRKSLVRDLMKYSEVEDPYLRTYPADDEKAELERKFSKICIMRVPGFLDAIKTDLAPLALSGDEIWNFAKRYGELQKDGLVMSDEEYEPYKKLREQTAKVLTQFNANIGPIPYWLDFMLTRMKVGCPAEKALDVGSNVYYTPGEKSERFSFSYPDVSLEADALGQQLERFSDSESDVEIEYFERLVSRAIQNGIRFLPRTKSRKSNLEDRLWWLVQVLIMNRKTDDILDDFKPRNIPDESMNANNIDTEVRKWAKILQLPLPVRQGKHR